ncbi:hypothetical protein EDB83DRAFT_2317683 [Lactarius deliciosus]|nr:hypothetical protein EDB83DRAFT_2317683 [Lactarius deliciosus]
MTVNPIIISGPAIWGCWLTLSDNPLENAHRNELCAKLCARVVTGLRIDSTEPHVRDGYRYELQHNQGPHDAHGPRAARQHILKWEQGEHAECNCGGDDDTSGAETRGKNTSWKTALTQPDADIHRPMSAGSGHVRRARSPWISSRSESQQASSIASAGAVAARRVLHVVSRYRDLVSGRQDLVFSKQWRAFLVEEYRSDNELNEGKGGYNQTWKEIWVFGPEGLREVIWPAILWSTGWIMPGSGCRHM